MELFTIARHPISHCYRDYKRKTKGGNSVTFGLILFTANFFFFKFRLQARLRKGKEIFRFGNRSSTADTHDDEYHFFKR